MAKSAAPDALNRHQNEDHLERMREEKTCPDCAELVAAQARVCRFCGYRFAKAPASNPLHWLFRPADTRSLPEFLLDCGIELAQDEEVAFFGLCEMDQSSGFLLVTNRRLAFFAARGSRKLLDWPLEHFRDIEIRGRRRRACLYLTGDGGDVTLRHFASEAALRNVADALAPAR
jgi:hypothetical protein